MPSSNIAKQSYDLCIIGGGPGGFAAAMRALDLGKHICLVEGRDLGGAGVKWGALASKTLWELSRDYAVAAKVDRGYRAQGLQVDYNAVHQTVMEAVREKQYQLRSQLETFSPQRYPGPGSITLKRGWARLRDSNHVAITGRDGSEEVVQAQYLLLAPGSRPRGFKNVEVDQQQVLDSDGVLGLSHFPKRLLILGAGVIGCEYATAFANFGQTQVHLVDHKERVLPFEDVDVSAFVQKNLESQGVRCYQNAQLRDVERVADGLEVILDYPDGRTQVVEVDQVLLSVGRQPNLEHLGLEEAGLACTPQGFLETSAYCHVCQNIYAAGDVTQHPNLVNIAELEGRRSVLHMFGCAARPLNYRNMSSIMFFQPSVAAVGLNEQQCQQQGLSYRVAIFSNALLTRAIAMRAVTGFVKILVTDDDELQILGMRAAGPQVSNTVLSIAHFMDHEKGAMEVLKSVYPHPSISEGTQECLRLLIGKSVYKPAAFPEYLRLQRWQPQTGYQDLAQPGPAC